MPIIRLSEELDKVALWFENVTPKEHYNILLSIGSLSKYVERESQEALNNGIILDTKVIELYIRLKTQRYFQTLKEQLKELWES